LILFVPVDISRTDGGSVEEVRREIRFKGIMHNVFIPPTLIISLLLALVALVLNAVSPGAAAVTGAVAALIFLAMMFGWGR
jgi:hypothetical protein